MAKKVSKRRSLKFQFLIIFGLITSVVFLPSTVILAIGMMPTVAAALVDRSKRKTKAVTVGAMNLAGCTPFLLDLWSQGHKFEDAVSIISEPRAIIVIYVAAVVGYLIDWAMAGIVASILYQRGLARKKAIVQRQKDLIERWGREVSGELPLDEQGFPVVQVPKIRTQNQ
jgi:hypothetical protein